jgi:hypothetical protein
MLHIGTYDGASDVVNECTSAAISRVLVKASVGHVPVETDSIYNI